MSNARVLSWVAGTTIALALTACDKARPVAPDPFAALRCTECHGDPSRTAASALDRAAPPAGVRGGRTPTDPDVGAHQAHLIGKTFSRGFACVQCHTAPSGVHPSGKVEFAFASQGNWAPDAAYDRTARTCSNTACHDLQRSGRKTPAWDAAGGVVCGSCHDLPPPPSSGHPAVPGGLTGCAACHPDTMKADGSLDVAGGRHVNGSLDVTGHADWSSPAVHGPKFLDFLAGVAGSLDCRLCHGQDYTGRVGASGVSCASCHAAAGWAGWATNCSFCHGARTSAAKAGYAVAAQPAWAAPPDDVQGRLTGTNTPARSGAHQAHLRGQGSDGQGYAAAFACATCHAVPADLGHVRGSSARAIVSLGGAGQAKLPASLGHYDPASGACATYCHGASGSPPWSGAPVHCGSCHAIPPAGHATGLQLTDCNTCHSGTVKPDGTLDLAGGLHLDGLVEAAGGHTDLTSPALHGPRFFDFVAGIPGALACTGCHGQDYGGGIGPSCNACHATAGWAAWRTDCSFCHGQKTSASQAGYAFADHPAWAAPPDDITGRLTGANTPARTGAHQVHLSGTATDGKSYASPFACATCHAVPGDLSHIRGAGARAAVALAGAGQGSLPASLGSYDPGSGTCAVYCHGSSLETSSGAAPAPVTWSGAAPGCADACHGAPPPTGRLDLFQDPSTGGLVNLPLHVGHYTNEGVLCGKCHVLTATADVFVLDPLTLSVDLSHHVNGAVDVVLSDPASGRATWDPLDGTCTSVCHSLLYRKAWR